MKQYRTSQLVWIGNLVIFAILAGQSGHGQALSGTAQAPGTAQVHGKDPASAKVRVIINRCLARDYFVTPDGVQGVHWVPPSDEDYQEMRSIGTDAVNPLSLHLDDPNEFVQLLAVKFLAAVGGDATFAPLVHATGSDKWVMVRLAAADNLAVSPNPEKKIVLRSLIDDKDALMAKRAREILASLGDAVPN